MTRAPELEKELLNAVAGSFSQSADKLRGQIDLLTTLSAQQNASVKQNTDALVQNTVTRSSESPVATASKSILSTLGGGLFLSPLISGIARLFGRKNSEETPALTQAVRPEPLSLDAILAPDSRAGVSSFDFDQQGQPRRISATPPPSQQVTIQVQALDSRSIIDRSDDIARALREAMLHSHSVNDVIGEI